MRLPIIKILSIGLIAMVVGACGTKKQVDLESGDRLPKMEEELLIQQLNELSKARPDYFYTRYNSRFSDNNTNVSFKTTVRMTADSALQASISFANIPIYNAVITPDTLSLVDRRNKCFIQEGTNFFKQQFNVDFSHRNIEELLLGLPIAWNEETIYKQASDPYNYVVVPDEKSDQNVTNDYFIRYYLDDEAKQLRRVTIDSPKDTTSIIVDYSEHIDVDNFTLPKRVEVRIKTARNDIFVDFRQARTEINEPQTIILAIPETYERCE